MFSGAEDEDLFNPTSSSNLASLFGTSMTPKQDGDASLTYTAPKQPKIGGQDTPTTSPKAVPQSTVICFKFVNAFKLIDRHHEAQGKCGFAVIGNETLKTYEVIMYKSKQEIIMRTLLKSDFIFTIQNNNFAHFCDNKNQQWSVHFENYYDVDYFIKNIEEHGGKIVYSNKVVDPNHISQEKKPITEEKTKPSKSPKPTKDKDSDSCSDASSNQTKANILSRMAKMGQSILPANVPNKSLSHSDSETDGQELNRKSLKKRQKNFTAKGEHLPNNKEKVSNNNQALNVNSVSVPEFVMINGQMVPVSALKQNLPTSFPNSVPNQLIPNIPNQFVLNQPQVSPMSDSLHIFIAENRTHNCELRMNMTQLNTKLDEVLEKLNKNGNTTPRETEDINDLRLRLEKEMEKNKLLTKHMEENQNDVEKSTAGDRKAIEDLKLQVEKQSKIIFDQEQKIIELEHYKDMSEVHRQVEDHQNVIASLNEIIENQKGDLEQLRKLCAQDKETTVNLNQLNEELNKSIGDLKAQLACKNVEADLFVRKLKQAMNILYHQIMENFEDENVSFPSAHIKQIISHKLKAATFMLIEEFHRQCRMNQETARSESNESVASSSQL